MPSDYKGDKSEPLAEAKGCDDEPRAEAKCRAKSEDSAERRARVVRAVCEYYFDSPELEAKMERFAEQNCGPFDSAQEEHSLEQTEIHDRFRALFERCIEDFIESLDVTIGEFYEMIADDMASSEFYSGSTFAHVVNALVKFESFHEVRPPRSTA